MESIADDIKVKQPKRYEGQV